MILRPFGTISLEKLIYCYPWGPTIQCCPSWTKLWWRHEVICLHISECLLQWVDPHKCKSLLDTTCPSKHSPKIAIFNKFFLVQAWSIDRPASAKPHPKLEFTKALCAWKTQHVEQLEVTLSSPKGKRTLDNYENWRSLSYHLNWNGRLTLKNWRSFSHHLWEQAVSKSGTLGF